MRKKTTQNDENEICEMYISGMTQEKIGEKFNIHRVSVLRILKKYKIKARHPSSWSRKYEINEDLFEQIDQEWKAYFLGFMYADGNVSKNGYEASLQLSGKDKEILDKFSICIWGKGKHPLGYCKARGGIKVSYRLRIINKKIVSDLMKLGVIPQKSLILRFPLKVPKNMMHHFIRGYFDGDGHICVRKREGNGWRKCWSITSSVYFNKSLKSFLERNLGMKIRFTKVRKYSSIVCESLEHLQALYGYLYKNSTIFLKRKHDIFQLVESL